METLSSIPFYAWLTITAAAIVSGLAIYLTVKNAIEDRL